jgi:ectoine hydroxylase-related dioxygenase (phytanoyl-CoA dioxygenase family)
MIQLAAEPKATLSNDQLSFFEAKGYLVMPQFLEPSHCQELKRALDNLMAARKRQENPMVISENAIGHLVSHEKTMEVTEALLGENFVLHHIHADRHDAGRKGVHWHHDYEQNPQVDRKYGMIHVFYYLNGLNGEIGDLLAVPGTHKMVSQRSLAAFGENDLPGYITFNQLPAGSAVFVHSALYHARRAKPGGENNPRYFIDTSYCQKGPLWPAYPNNKKISEFALSAGYDKGGKYAFLFDHTQFQGQESEKLY